MKSINLTQFEARAFASDSPPTLIVRVMKPPPKWLKDQLDSGFRKVLDLGNGLWGAVATINSVGFCRSEDTIRCPFGAPGTLLAGKEAFQVVRIYEVDNGVYEAGYPLDFIPENNNDHVFSVMYRADGDEGPWRPAQHMPLWAVRTLLRTKSVTVKRVQEICTNECRQYGIHDLRTPENEIIKNYLDCFAEHWDATHKPGQRWDDNVPCWFAVVERAEKGEGDE